MRKNLLLTAAILAVSLPVSAVLAEPPGHGGAHHMAFSSADAAAFTNARIAALKAGLELTPAQQKLWPPFEAALRDLDKARIALRQDKADTKGKEAGEPRDLVAMMRMSAKALAARGAEMEKLADAAQPLYDSLDEAQKRRFGVLLHTMRHAFHPRPMGHMGPGPQMGRGPQRAEEPEGED